MSVRFLCRTCQGLLKTGRRKIGAQVECPKCGSKTTVPSEQAAAAELAMARGSREKLRGTAGPLDDFIVYDYDDEQDDDSGLGSATPATQRERAMRPLDTRWPAPGRWSQSSPARQGLAGGTFVLVKRKALYVQAALFAMVGLIFLAAGVLIGVGASASRSATDDESSGQSAAQPGGEAFTWSLEFAFTDGEGQRQSDEGAVVLALPVGRAKGRFAGAALAPGGPPPPPATLLALAYVGGAHARADAFGRAELRVPAPGEYSLVFLSAYLAEKAEPPPAEALVELDRFFTDAARLAGQRRMRFERRVLTAAAKDEQLHFGAAGDAMGAGGL